jgi:hypothetical protein
MAQKTADIIVKVYASLFAVGGLFLLFLLIRSFAAPDIRGSGVLGLLLLLQAFASAGLFLRRQWGRILALVICALVVLLMVLLVIPGSGVRLLWSGAGALAVVILDTLVAVCGLYAFGFHKDVKALFTGRS